MDDLIELKRQRFVAIWTLFVIVVLTCFDIWEDYLDGAPTEHIVFEIFLTGIGVIALIFIWYRTIKFWSTHTVQVKTALRDARKDVERWRNEVTDIRKGLSKAISDQLERWSLTEAEKEIAMLLIKGLSTKEIAVVRETSERTVRQQAAGIYSKSGVEGRAQLAAFFLEDLLTPIT